MGWNDASETVVAGAGEAYVAPVGTPLPVKADDALNAAFFGLGYHSEDGVSINRALEVVEFGAWQEKIKIRRERDSEDFTFSFTLLQWNEISTPLAMGGGAITSVGGSQYKYTPPAASAALDEKTMICDVQDGARIMRFIVPRGSVTDGVEVGFKPKEMAGLSVSFKALAPTDGSAPWYFVTNDALAFAVGS